MVKVIDNQIIKISKQALKKGVVILDLKEYERLREETTPTYYLKGKEAEKLDKLVEEGLREYKKGKCRVIKSLADLN
ncbi:MAG: hypothetical protein COT33_01110 [Candidatus Nealsonbacteria bacterium CG08_land_8_20_14_0_20_38_20]|uniref:Uncharacterized protein n=1 Tax=Candidatus Nealsonbacteria bacterium CG08_land_8_20_14_0_20_38_20 TaxID=1974705 RepID=A0A2H0YPC2_9BACT|nr:MAG: hypothetical protein COT33_01110 [Candidatus Nealsonbacteria bacterium CG08_land_8_20_14_0_20_38_20]